METNDTVGNVPIVVPADSQVENPVLANMNPAGTVEAAVPENVAADGPHGDGTVTGTPERVCAHCGKEIPDGEPSYETHDGDTICGECFCEHYFTCADCGEIRPLSESVDVGNGGDHLVCESCRDDHWHRCHECDRWFNTDESFELEFVDSVDDYVCESCLDSHYCRCDCCDEYFRNCDLYSVSAGGYVCESCRDEHYFVCHDCDGIFHVDDRIVDDDGYEYCPGCHDARNCHSHGVMDYHYGRKRGLYSPRREGSEPSGENLFFGVELECENGTFDADGFDDWTEDGNLVHFECDSSLDDGGVEMITQPCTLRYHQDAMRWNDLCATLIGQGFLSHKAENCGLHVHLSRAALRPSTIVKMDVFINHAKLFWSQIARRETFYGYGGKYDEKKKASIAKGKFERGDYQGERYTAVNANNSSTVEVRIFKGTLKAETVLGTIEILHGLVRFLDRIPIPRIYDTEANVIRFIDFLAENNDLYPHVLPMLRRLVRRGEGMKKRIGTHYGRLCESRNDGENY